MRNPSLPTTGGWGWGGGGGLLICMCLRCVPKKAPSSNYIDCYNQCVKVKETGEGDNLKLRKRTGASQKRDSHVHLWPDAKD